MLSVGRSALVSPPGAGETDEAIGARIDQLETGLARAHADTWARTESTRYYTLGRSAAIEAADDVWGYEYVVIVDNRTTTICRAFVGKRVAKAAMGKFPPFHYNCRTTVAAVFFDEAPEVDDELGEDAQPAEGFGADPREVMRRADPSNRAEPEPAVLKKPGRLPDETPPPVQKHVGGPRGLRKLELATDAARQSWLKAGKPTEGKAYDEYERAWTKLAQARQARIRASELGLTQELAEQARRRIRAELDRLRSRRVEWAIIFDRRGRVLWRGTSGLAGQVRFPGDDLPGGHPSAHWRGAILAHNHPLELSAREWPGFGDEDLRTAMLTGAAESWALYPFGDEWRRAVVSPPQAGWSVSAEDLDQRLSEAHSAALQHEHRRFPDATAQRVDVWAEALTEMGNQGLLRFVLEAGR